VRLCLNKKFTEELGFSVYFTRTTTPIWRIAVEDASEVEVGGEITLKELPCGERCQQSERWKYPMDCAKPGWEGATLHMYLVSHAPESLAFSVFPGRFCECGNSLDDVD
jgi:hypothetical protein